MITCRIISKLQCSRVKTTIFKQNGSFLGTCRSVWSYFRLFNVFDKQFNYENAQTLAKVC